MGWLEDSRPDMMAFFTGGPGQPARGGAGVQAPPTSGSRVDQLRAQSGASPGFDAAMTERWRHTDSLMGRMGEGQGQARINWPPPPVPGERSSNADNWINSGTPNTPSAIGELQEGGSSVDPNALGAYNDSFGNDYDDRAPTIATRMSNPTDSVEIWGEGDSGAAKAATTQRQGPKDSKLKEVFDQRAYWEIATNDKQSHSAVPPDDGFRLAEEGLPGGMAPPSAKGYAAGGEEHPLGKRRDTSLFRELRGSEIADTLVSGLFYGAARKSPFAMLEGARQRAGEIRGEYRRENLRDFYERAGETLPEGAPFAEQERASWNMTYPERSRPGRFPSYGSMYLPTGPYTEELAFTKIDDRSDQGLQVAPSGLQRSRSRGRGRNRGELTTDQRQDDRTLKNVRDEFRRRPAEFQRALAAHYYGVPGPGGEFYDLEWLAKEYNITPKRVEELYEVMTEAMHGPEDPQWQGYKDRLRQEVIGEVSDASRPQTTADYERVMDINARR